MRFIRLHEWRLHRQLRNTDLKGQLEISQKELSKQRRVIEKQLKKERRARVGTKRHLHLTGRAGRSTQAESGRHHRAAFGVRARAPQTVAGRVAWQTVIRPSQAQRSPAAPGVRENYVLPGLDLLDEHDQEGRDRG